MSRRTIDPGYFEEAVQRAGDLCRTRIFPGFLERYFSGKGYHFVARLLEAHDRWDPRMLLALPEAEEKWRVMAEVALDKCPVNIEDGISRESRDSIVLARFFIEDGKWQNGVQEETRRWIVIYRGSFEVSWFDSGGGRDVLEDAILKTLFHEYVHFFESFFMLSEQPLATREGHRGGFKPKRLTPAQAEALDREYEAGNPWFWILILAFAVASALFIAWGMK